VKRNELPVVETVEEMTPEALEELTDGLGEDENE